MRRPPIKYSKEELTWLSDNRTKPISEYHSEFIKLFSRQDIEAKNLHSLRKRKGWKTGRTGHFQKGHEGYKGGPGGPNKTSFKPGNKPKNWKPVGSKRISVDGYQEVKTKEPSTWEQSHILFWTKHKGAIPSGHCVVFIDGNKQNISLENLELITRNEHLQINKLKCYSHPEQTRPVVRTIGKLIAKTNEMTSN